MRKSAWVFAAVCAASLGISLGISAARADNNATTGQSADHQQVETGTVGEDEGHSNTGADTTYHHVDIPACAKDPDKLGISRVVEIDAADGPIFGGSPHAHNNFLEDHEVVLTFDDGPLRAYTQRVLNALERHCSRATFFMVGRMAVSDPAMVREVIAAGHTVGSHTFAHRNLRATSKSRAISDFELGYSAVTKAAGQPIAPFFRFPYLSESKQVLAQLKSRNMATFFIDVDSKDYQSRNPDVMFKRTMRDLNAAGKGIILMHDIQRSTAGSIDRLLDTLHEQGYKLVHIVPKVSEPTLAEFDVPAAQALSAKSAKAKNSPMADRTVTWTMPDKAKARDDAKAAKPVSASNDTHGMPWASQTQVKPRSAPNPAARPEPAEELPWQSRAFSN